MIKLIVNYTKKFYGIYSIEEIKLGTIVESSSINEVNIDGIYKYLYDITEKKSAIVINEIKQIV